MVVAAGVPSNSLIWSQIGRPTPDQFCPVVQAIIDGVVRNGGSPSTESQIRMLMWNYGVGIDCAGYVQQAFLAVRKGTRATYGMKDIGNENLAALSPRAFRTVPVERAHIGDLIILDPPEGETVGHMIVNRHYVFDTQAENGSQRSDALPFVSSDGASSSPSHFSWSTRRGGRASSEA